MSSIPRPVNVAEKKKLLWNLVYARRDMDLVISTCDAVLNQITNEDDPLYHAASSAIALFYARPFKRSNIVGKLDDSFGDYGVPVANELHRRLVNARDQVVAHSDGDFYQMKVEVQNTAVADGMMHDVTPVPEQARLKLSKIPEIRALAREQLKKVNSAFECVALELFESHYHPDGIYQLTIDETWPLIKLGDLQK